MQNFNNINNNLESLIINFNLEHEKNQYNISLFDTGNDLLKIIAEEIIDENSDMILPNKYGIILLFFILKN